MAFRFVICMCAFALLVGLARAARAADEAPAPIVIWPTLTPAGDDASPVPLHKPKESDADVAARAQELDVTFHDAAQDLGYALDVADPGPTPGHTRDDDMVARAARSGSRGNLAQGTWVVSPRIEKLASGSYLLRIVAIPPKGRQLRVRVETVTASDVPVRGLVMLRDLLSAQTAAQLEAARNDRTPAQSSNAIGIMGEVRSPGRAVLAVNGAGFGAFAAYSIHRASGSEDPRLLYPLLALGTGIGVGSALLVSEEWNISTGDAWYLAAGAWWGTAAGLLITTGRNLQPVGDRFSWAVGGGVFGLSLATFGLTRSKMDEGDAVLTHSGGAFGFLLGGMTQMAYEGTTDLTPHTGAGWGAAFGVVTAGTVAIWARVSPSRVLLVDMGAGLGALAGAAAGSPLVFEDLTPGKTRGFLAATAGGMLAGGVVAALLTRDKPPEPQTSRWRWGVPTAGVIGASATPEGAVPAYGVGWRGGF
jgi:hypothetical protein